MSGKLGMIHTAVDDLGNRGDDPVALRIAISQINASQPLDIHRHHTDIHPVVSGLFLQLLQFPQKASLVIQSGLLIPDRLCLGLPSVLIQGIICLGDQISEIVSRFMADRAIGKADAILLELFIGLGDHRLDDLSGDRMTDDCKFIAPEAIQLALLWQTLTNAVRHQHQHLVSLSVPVFVIDHLETVHIDDGQIKFLLGELTGLGHHRMAIHQTGQFICHKDLCHMIIVVHAGTDCQCGTEQMSAGEEIVHDGGIGQCDCDHKDHKIFQRIIPAGIQDGKDQHQNDNTKKQYVGHPAKGSIL